MHFKPVIRKIPEENPKKYLKISKEKFRISLVLSIIIFPGMYFG